MDLIIEINVNQIPKITHKSTTKPPMSKPPMSKPPMSKPISKSISKPNSKPNSKSTHKPNIKNIKEHYQTKFINHLCIVCNKTVSLRKSIVICKCDSTYHKQCFAVELKICPKCKQ